MQAGSSRDPHFLRLGRCLNLERYLAPVRIDPQRQEVGIDFGVQFLRLGSALCSQAALNFRAGQKRAACWKPLMIVIRKLPAETYCVRCASVSTSRGGQTDVIGIAESDALVLQLSKPTPDKALIQKIRVEPYPLI